ncbi:Glycosyl hydrolases family 43 [bacterium A37T11]|nr:Glycosyl hydrolases family 43 [bacterium A37T11]
MAFVIEIVLGRCSAQMKDEFLFNGIPWFDDQDRIVNAHGACMVKDGDRYYLFGEYKTDSVNQFNGFSCYSSTDLVNWKFERLVLPVQKEGLLGPGRIGERVKVMKCPETGEYVMFMHTDNKGYVDPHIGYATSKTIAGEYEFKGPLLYNGQPIARWDMGTFQDMDGSGYLLTHGGDIYRLNNTYHAAVEKIANDILGASESPAMFKKNGIYYYLFSHLTSWERNDNFYYTATNIKGPWLYQGIFAPAGSLTHNSQTTFVFPLVRDNDTIPLYMGDRWSFPHQASAATYVWLPMKTEGTKLSIPTVGNGWDVKSYGQLNLDSFKMLVKGFKKPFVSHKKGQRMTCSFTGSGVGIVGDYGPHGGYGRVQILDKRGKIYGSTWIDFYSKVPGKGIRYLSPKLPNATYSLTVEVTGEKPVWSNKAKTIFYGSDDCFVTVDSVLVF